MATTQGVTSLFQGIPVKNLKMTQGSCWTDTPDQGLNNSNRGVSCFEKSDKESGSSS